ncbi:MAG: homoserine kinase [Chthonomonadales bacterium]|nr:homoserine kinase [Chthonomonadales bacterium]
MGMASDYHLRWVRVRVPATSANIGPGFDSMGIALDLWNEFTLTLDRSRRGVHVTIEGEGADTLPRDATHLALATLFEDLAAHGLAIPEGVHLHSRNEVPAASGLGSSSSAVVAGLLMGAALIKAHAEGRAIRAHEVELGRVLSRAVELEGHGDNVTPAIFGGLQVVYTHGDHYRNRAIPIPPTKVVVCVPDYAYLTTDARAALPKLISHADAVFNIGHAMLVAEALRSQDDALLADAMRDSLHEPYRIPAIPGASAARASALHAGAIAVCLSGAGPGLMAFARRDHDRIGEAMAAAFRSEGLTSRYWVLSATVGGARLEIG